MESTLNPPGAYWIGAGNGTPSLLAHISAAHQAAPSGQLNPCPSAAGIELSLGSYQWMSLDGSGSVGNGQPNNAHPYAHWWGRSPRWPAFSGIW